MNKQQIQFCIDYNLEIIADFERDIQGAEKQLLQCRRDHNVRSKQIQAGEMIEWLERSGIPWLKETQGMIQEHVEILRLQLTGLSYEDATDQLLAGIEQGTLF